MRRFQQYLDVVPFGLMLSFMAYGFVLPVKKLNLLFPDDSFFYIKTAVNIQQGVGSTFDGINFSNGYHPLYMFLLSAISMLKSLSSPNGLYVVLFVDGLLFLVFLYLLLRFLKENGMHSLGRFIVLMLCTTMLGLYDFGNESRLLLPLGWWYAFKAQAAMGKKTVHGWLLGLMGGFVFLARLDAILWVICIALFLCLEQYRDKKIWRDVLTPAIQLLLPVVLAVIGFALYNWIVFSSPTSVSSLQKFGWPGTFATRWLFTAGFAVKARFIFSLITAVCYFLWYRKIKTTTLNRPFFHFLNSLAVYTCLYLLVLVFWGRGEIRFWYFVLPLSFSFLVWALWIDQLLQHRLVSHRALFQGGIILMLLLFFAGTGHKKLTWNGRADAWSMAEWLKIHTPGSAKFFQVDGCGITGYFSERAVINGDGLINSWEYQRVLQRNQLKPYLVEKKVEYIVWNRYREGEEIKITVPLKNTPGFLMTFAKPPEILARFGSLIVIRPDFSDLRITPDRF